MPNFYIDGIGRDEDALRRAFAWLAEVYKGPRMKVLMAAPTLYPLQSIETVLAAQIGSSEAKQLADGKPVTVSGENVELVFDVMTNRKKKYSWDGPVFVLYPDQGILEKIDGLPGKTDVLVVTWERSVVRPWIARHQASPVS